MSVSPTCLHVVKGHNARIWSIVRLPNGNLATASEDSNIKIWDPDGNCLKILTGHSLAVFSLTVLAGTILVSGSKDTSVMFWTMEGIEIGKVIEASSILAVLALNNGYLAVGAFHSVKIYQLVENRLYAVEGTLAGHSDTIYTMKTKDHYLYSGGKDSKIIMWDTNNFKYVRTFDGHTNTICDLLPVGQKLYSASADATIRIWNINSGQCLRILNEHNLCIHTLAHATRRVFLSSGRDSQIIAWDNVKSIPIFHSHSHNSIIDVLIFDKNQMIGGTIDGRVMIWNTHHFIRSLDMVLNYKTTLRRSLLVDVDFLFAT
jgi:WD40 repeat protein